MEEWRDIPGYLAEYQVSSEGRVRSLDIVDVSGRKLHGQLLSLRHRRDGYLDVMLHHDGKSTRYYVHQLVAKAFVHRKHGLLELNHKDEDKTNNRATNLEWCTRSYNVQYNNLLNKRKPNKRLKIKGTVDGRSYEFGSARKAAAFLIFRHRVFTIA